MLVPLVLLVLTFAAPAAAADNCRKEFMYAARKKTSRKMLAVPMEPSVLNPNAWDGPVSAHNPSPQLL